jgi:flavin-dependent dehydrogenase
MALVTYVTGVRDCRDVGEIFVDPPDYAILNPLAPDRINLSLVVPLAHAAAWRARLEDFFVARIKQLPHLSRRLAGADRVAPLSSLGPLAYRVVPPREGGVLLVGDAAGFYDPFTGEGIFTALRSAELAAGTVLGALRAGDVSATALAVYERARRAAFADKERLTRGLQAVIGRRRLANLVAHWLAARPRVLAALLGVIGDYVPPRALPRLLLS